MKRKTRDCELTRAPNFSFLLLTISTLAENFENERRGRSFGRTRRHSKSTRGYAPRSRRGRMRHDVQRPRNPEHPAHHGPEPPSLEMAAQCRPACRSASLKKPPRKRLRETRFGGSSGKLLASR